MNNKATDLEAPARIWLLLNQEGRWISTTPEAAQYVGGSEYIRADLARVDPPAEPIEVRLWNSRASVAAPPPDWLQDAGAILCVNGPDAGARVEIRFSELADAQRLHKALVETQATRSPVAVPVDAETMPNAPDVDPNRKCWASTSSEVCIDPRSCDDRGCQLYAGEDYEDRNTPTNKELRAELITSHDTMPRRWCSVHNREEFKYESLEHELHAAPSDSSVRAAAEEIVPDCLSRTCFIKQCGYDHCWGCEDAVRERERIAAILSKHLRSAAGGELNHNLRSQCCDAPTRVANTDYNVCAACKEACDTVIAATPTSTDNSGEG